MEDLTHSSPLAPFDVSWKTCPCCATAITSSLLSKTAVVYARLVVLRCTRRALELLGNSAVARVDPPASDDDWYLNLLWLERRKCLLFTHAGTLFSAFVGDVRAADLRPIGPTPSP